MNGCFTPTKFPQLHRKIIWTVHLHWVPSSSRGVISPGKNPRIPTKPTNASIPPKLRPFPPAPLFLQDKKSRFWSGRTSVESQLWINWRKQDVSIWKNLCWWKIHVYQIYIRYTISWYFCGGIRGAIIIFTFGPALSTVTMDFLVENGFPSFKKICSHCGTGVPSDV